MKRLIFLLSISTLMIHAQPRDIFKRIIVPYDNKLKIPECMGKIETHKEFININSQDPILKESFYNIINENKKNNLPFILALTKTKVDNIYYRHYFSAPELNHWLFGECYEKQFSTNNWRNPINNKEIKEDILYFKIESIRDKFEYLCSTEDLFKEEIIDTHVSDFSVSQNSKFLKQYIMAVGGDSYAQLSIAKQFFNQHKYDISIKWLSNSIKNIESDQDIDINLILLAKCYHKLNDLKSAEEYYKRSLSVYYNIESKRKLGQIQLEIGKQYEHGIGKPVNLKKAIAYYANAYKNDNKKGLKFLHKILLYKEISLCKSRKRSRNNFEQYQPNKKLKID